MTAAVRLSVSDTREAPPNVVRSDDDTEDWTPRWGFAVPHLAMAVAGARGGKMRLVFRRGAPAAVTPARFT